jgi:tetratricopeptide (TPR) repeat protein
MRSPVSGTTEHSASPRTGGSAGYARSALLLWLVVALILVPAVSAADTVTQEAPAEEITPEENVTTVENITPSHTLSAEEIEAAIKDQMDQAVTCYNQKKYSCAIDHFESAHLLDPEDYNPVYMQSVVLMSENDYNGAVSKIDEAIKLAPRNANLWLKKGNWLNKAGRFTESDACFNRALELNPNAKISPTSRFPFNLGMKNLMIVTIAIGFSCLGLFIYFREFRH